MNLTRVTIKDIAKAAGVSIATVSHVINDSKYVSNEKRKAVTDAIELLNYAPNVMARNLRNQKTNTAGLIVSSFPDSYVTGIIQGIGNRARELGYHLLFVNTNENPQYERDAIKLLSSSMVDGIILSPTSSKIDYLKMYIEERMPIVLVNRYDPRLGDIPKVTVDDLQAGYDATMHLLQHGHRNIGLIQAVPNVTSTLNRIEGYKLALNEYGIPFQPENLEIGHATVEGGFAAARSLLEREKQITALFTLSDLMTIGAVKAIQSLFLKCPDDIALIGFGDFEAASAIHPPVTNVNPPSTLGQTAFDVLVNKINHLNYTHHVKLPVSLVIRKSCGC